MLASKFVYPFALSAAIAVPASSKIAVQSQAAGVQVWQRSGYPNLPTTLSLLRTLAANEEWVSDAFSAAATILIEANSTPVAYSIGTSPRVLTQAAAQKQGTPGALNATGTLTAEMILSGLVTSTAAAAVAATLDTGAVLDAATSMEVGDSFDWDVIVTGANAFTVTAAASGHTVVGNMVVAATSSARFRTRKTAADTFVTYASPVPIS